MALSYHHDATFRVSPACIPAGCHIIVTGCQLGLVSCWSPLVLGALPPAVAAPVPVLEAWVTCALNVASGALFVVGSYVILGAPSRCLAPARVFGLPQLRDCSFWGSACYLVVSAAGNASGDVQLLWHAAIDCVGLNSWQGSASMLMGAIVTQPLVPMAPGFLINARSGHFFGYVVGSLWFVAGALANIAGIAQEQAPGSSRVSVV